MTAKDVKCRKEHNCSYCGGVINIGELAEYNEGKCADFDINGKQIGIIFWKAWFHSDIEICKSIIEKEVKTELEKL